MLDALVTSRRGSGVLLHPTSLEGPGIGDLGSGSDRFIHWLADAGQSFWQILPLVPVDAGGSPYNGLSALAGNPLLLAPALLVQDGLLEEEKADSGQHLPEDQVQYEAVARIREEQTKSAHARFRAGHGEHLAAEFDRYQTANAGWLEDYALFRALREHHGNGSWLEWPADIRDRQPEAIERWSSLLADEVEWRAFEQFLFDRQWRRVRGIARQHGIRIIGDLPIFVAHDSSDVWSNPELFQLEPGGAPTVVSGVPPDYFSETGQLWGNPLYRWGALRERGYDWWVQRFRRTLELVDVIRIDHFRGFESFWEVPAEAQTAQGGRWVEGPGGDFFAAVERRLGKLPLIAEDLGLITPAVERLRNEMGFPGMRVLQFAFDGDARNTHLPRNYTPGSVAYTGTHDNDTIAGWWAGIGGEERGRAREWLRNESPGPWDFIEAVFASPAALAIIPLQDLLELGSGARMNTPGRSAGNWTWRIGAQQPDGALAARLHELTARYHRLPAR